MNLANGRSVTCIARNPHCSTLGNRRIGAGSRHGVDVGMAGDDNGLGKMAFADCRMLEETRWIKFVKKGLDCSLQRLLNRFLASRFPVIDLPT